MSKCCAPMCSNATYNIPHITFHRFPTNVNLKNVWLRNMNVENWQPKKFSVLCSKHFESDCVDRSGFRTRLIPGAIPTIFHSPLQEKCVAQGASLSAAQAQVAQTSTQAAQHPDDAELNSGDDLSEDEAPATFRRPQQVPAASTSAGGAGKDPHDAGSCDSCHRAITGLRHVCVQCEYSHCAACEAAGRHDHHYMLRVPRQHQQVVVEKLVKMIQMELADVVSYEKPPYSNEEQPILKTDIKVEVPDPLAEDTPSTEQLRPDILEQAMLEINIKQEFDSDEVVDPPPPPSPVVQLTTAASLPAPCPAPPPGYISRSKRRSSSESQEVVPIKKSCITVHVENISEVTVKTEPLSEEESLQTHEETSDSGEAGVTIYDAEPRSKQKFTGRNKKGRTPKKKVKQ